MENHAKHLKTERFAQQASSRHVPDFFDAGS